MMPKICRIVTKTDNQQSNTKRLIDMYYAKTLPRATCLVTPGRFLTFNISSYPYIKANDPLCDNPQVIAAICNDAEKEIKAFLNQTQLHSIYEVITIGIDGENLVKTKIELVAIVIKANNSSPDIRWTGKSYPKSDEVHKLIRFRDYQSHCYTHGVERVLVLGCHDLSIYSSRGNKNLGSNSQKSTWNKKYKQVIANFNPTIVLHHPHRTDSTRTWRNAYANLIKTTRTIDSYASGILYQPKTSGRNPSNKLADVLRATAHNNYIDLQL